MPLPFLIFADKKGNIYRHPRLRMAVSVLQQFALPQEGELIALPKGSTLFYLPHRQPVGFNPLSHQFEVLREFEDKQVFAVGACLIPAYLRLYHPSYAVKRTSRLPLWAYTACGMYGGKFFAAARRIDARARQSPRFYAIGALKQAVKEFLKECPQNRLYTHLAHCALNYNCLAAKNLFLKRWEAPLPTSRFCNACCIGCLSYQETECLQSHNRIAFKPSITEIAQVMGNHLRTAKEAIVSFGQGCEGEPLLETDNIAKAVENTRALISRGTINMNTNASIPQNIERLCKAGIDSFRVSLNSPQEELYNRYFNPRDYTLSDVARSMEIAKKYKKFVSINLFVFPGVSDSREEISALVKFIKNTGIDMIQWRNLNIDPDFYLESCAFKKFIPHGILALIKIVRQKFPRLKMGYFNLPKEQFRRH